jgi:hypothetical protein
VTIPAVVRGLQLRKYFVLRFLVVVGCRILTRYVRIGWAHGDARVVDLNYYEDARPYRRKTLGMVLTREEREAILLHWGVSFNEIIDSIRTNIKVKNQRRQTVTNLGKVQRLEEAFESASRKLKRALLLKRRTGDIAKELRQQADTAATALSSLKIAEDHTLSQIRASQTPEAIEPDADNLENLHVAVQVSVSDFCRNSPENAKLLRRASSSSYIGEDDQVSCMSGFTLGNSETASVLEMEKFHRELELEMFGDMELPSMVGQTLEVPGVEIPEEDRVYRDPPSVSGLQELPSFYSAISQRDESIEYVHSRLATTGNMIDHSEIIYNQSEPARIPVSFESKEEILANVDSSMLSWSLEQGGEFPSIQRQVSHPVPVGPPAELYHHVPHHGAYYVPGDHPPANYARLSSTLDSAHAQASHPMVGGDHQLCQPARGQSSNAFATSPNYPLAAPNGSSHHRDRSSQQPQPRSRCRAASDGPEIRYVPPPTHLSPTQWMEGSSDGPSIHRAYEPVTIIEDAYERDTRYFMGGGQPYIDRGFDTYRPPTQFPPSFY